MLLEDKLIYSSKRKLWQGNEPLVAISRNLTSLKETLHSDKMKANFMDQSLEHVSAF